MDSCSDDICQATDEGLAHFHRVRRTVGQGLLRTIQQSSLRDNSPSVFAPCPVHQVLQKLVHNCHQSYSLFTQDDAAYGIAWKDLVNRSDGTNNSAVEFTYTSAPGLLAPLHSGHVGLYAAGGYTSTLKGPVDEMLAKVDWLRDNQWINNVTRAIFVEFTVFNPNTGLFAFVTALFEMPGIGGLLPSFHIESADFLKFLNASLSPGQIFLQVVVWSTVEIIFYPIHERAT
ncbi:unnamed protein product [Protopolystoma xenopodis]|uniref:Polycystin domain-containing protein n=1 Tax=Protopolystoma xenopodis TaxID=117903 RepID=A0A3S5CKM1_9PLAT|nr:unnamed protein product [Protopolystoma xenopodis]